MRVIISGGSGLIGRALAESLSHDGHETIILSRRPGSVKELPTRAKAVYWDGKSPQGWGALVNGADAVVNLAGASLKGRGFLPTRWTAARKRLIRQSRLDVGQAVAEAFRQAKRKPRVLIQASAVGYYGPHGDEPITEDVPSGHDFLAGVCVDWETSTTAVEQMGVRSVVIRTGLLLTLKGGAFPLLALPFRLLAGNWFGSGRQYYPWIHFDDHISALRFMIENSGAHGAYNLSAPHPMPNREFARILGKVMRRPVWLPIPGLALRLVLGEVSTVVLDGQRAVPTKLQKEGFSFIYPDLEPALRNVLAQ